MECNRNEIKGGDTRPKKRKTKLELPGCAVSPDWGGGKQKRELARTTTKE